VRALLLLGVISVFPEAAAAIPAGAVQARKLEAGKSALEKLRVDPRRRRYREGWETVLRTLDAAVKAAPRGPRAAEAALLAGRARAELWEVSRSRRDARAAISALRKVDEDYSGPAGAEALALASRVAGRAHETKDRAEIAMRMAGRSPQRAASGRLPPHDAPVPSPHREGLERSPPEAAESHDETAEEREPEVDAEAAKAVEQIVEDAKARANVRAGEGGGEEEDDAEEGPPEPEAPADPPMRSTPIVRAVKSAVAALTEPEDAPARAAKAREIRSAALGSGTSLAAQLGLKVRRVVVDAGHGGRDTGAIGARGVREKDLALAIAKKVAARLKALGFQVVMTRTKDVFVSLDDRTRIANEARADLFVSIHCNAARRRRLEGVETWTLNVASNRYAARLAAFENAEADRTVSDLRLILADLATKANASDARDLAQSVQSSLVRTLRSRVGPVRDHGVKQALFYVLLGTRMPSILVETGFISNPAEEARLKSGRFQDGTAEAIARGVKDFVDSRRRLARAP
jgi:N-acetylmuramoyl-L-alanine amidase